MVRAAAREPGQHRSDGHGSMMPPGQARGMRPGPQSEARQGAARESRGLFISSSFPGITPPRQAAPTGKPGVRQGNIGPGRESDSPWASGLGPVR
jgi:hypothetical protein